MEALLLAGGFGTRIRPLSYTRPKPLLPILNRPMIDRVLEQMPKAVDTVILPVNYLAELVEAHFEEHPDPRVVLVDEPDPLGTGGAIKNCEKHFTGPFIVYNADIVCSVDLEALVSTHEATRAKATISLWPVDEPWHFGVVRLDPTGRIVEFVEKPSRGQEPSNLINAGHYVLDPSLLDRLPPKKFASLEREVFAPFAAEGGAIQGHRFEGYWVDCGRPETFLEAHRAVLAHEGRVAAIGKDVTGLKQATVAGYAIGDGCSLGKGALVERSVLLAGVTLGAKAHIVDSILGEGVEVEDGATLEGCVVGDFAVVESGRRIKGQRIGMRAEDVKAA